MFLYEMLSEYCPMWKIFSSVKEVICGLVNFLENAWLSR